MLDKTVLRAARLRGSLPAESLGARGLERVARNPDCTRLRALTLASVTPATAARDVYGEAQPEGQSPFALSAGNRFERALLQDGFERLLRLYQDKGRLGPTEGNVVDLSALVPGTTRTVMARRREVTQEFLARKLAAHPKAPNILIKARLPVVLLGTEHDTEPDALVAAGSDPFYRPVEIKSYPDREGKTDPADVRGACRQAAVAVIGLRQALAKLGVTDHEDQERLVPPLGDLVLRQPGNFYPTLRPMTLRGEVFSLERILARTGRDLDEVEALLASIGPEAALNDPGVLDAIPCNYLESCREHCGLARHCKEQALAAGDPVLLGGRAREELAAAGTLERTLALMHGGATPGTPEEAALATGLREALIEYRRATS
jgi:hypothetical protein